MRLLARALAVVLALLPAAAHSQATLEAAPGVRVSTTYEYYDVQGATEREIRARLKRSGPEGHDAFTRWHIRWSYPHAVAGGRCAPGPVTAAGQAILERSRREHERYDEVTKHGLTQGARWR